MRFSDWERVIQGHRATPTFEHETDAKLEGQRSLGVRTFDFLQFQLLSPDLRIVLELTELVMEN